MVLIVSLACKSTAFLSFCQENHRKINRLILFGSLLNEKDSASSASSVLASFSNSHIRREEK
jgi:hypothetical protein